MRTKFVWKRRNLAAIVLAAGLLPALGGCASWMGTDGYKGFTMDAAGVVADRAEDAGSDSENGRPRPGQLTAGEWNDNKHYDFFKTLFQGWEETTDIPKDERADGEAVRGTENEPPRADGAFAMYADAYSNWGLYTQNRIEAEILDEAGKPAAGATAAILDGKNKTLAVAVAGADGKAYLFPDKEKPEEGESWRIVAGYPEAPGNYEGFAEAAPADERYTLTLAEPARGYAGMDLCFMIDTTGSMKDELAYLQSELGDVISRVQTELPGIDLRLALVFYRDVGDEYVTRVFDFTSDIASQQTVLAAQSAEKGGDTPEAVHEALTASLGLSWREGSRKILVPVLDAPPHEVNEKWENKTDAYGELVYVAAARGISAVPVAASGADTLTHYLMRSTALVTGGTYIFLTDDSGIGNSHERPAVGEFTVEYLNSCLVRVIGELYDGRERPAVDFRQDGQG